MSAYDSLIAPAAAHSPGRAISAVPGLFITLFLLVLISSCWLCLMFSNIQRTQKNMMSTSSCLEYFRSIVKVQMTKSRCNMTKWQRTVWEDIMIGLFLLQICLPAVPAGDTVTGKLEYLHKCKNRGWYHFWESTPGSRVAQIKKVIALMAYFLLSDH